MRLTPAAQYLRMSTDHQTYSLRNQAWAIADYAQRHRFRIVKTYVDGGRSGLTLSRREGLRRLLSDVVAEKRCFDAILVYDVSRWGRFQDVDESAHYEFLCKAAGAALRYCAEPFENDGSLASTLMKTLKRSLAAEFSRELGVQVRLGKKARVAAGFFVGGRTPYGFKRKIASGSPRRERVLEDGQRKYVRDEGLILVHGPRDEVECVRKIFKCVINDRMSAREIARQLNAEGILFRGRRWAMSHVQYILSNPEYAGFSVWGRTSQRLGLQRAKVVEKDWILKPNAFEEIVTPADFHLARTLLHSEGGRVFWTRERILEAARRLLKQNGRLRPCDFGRLPGVPSPRTIHKFGFGEICRDIGYEPPPRLVAFSQAIKNGFRIHRELVASFAACFPQQLSVLPITKQDRRQRLLFESHIVVSVISCTPAAPVHGGRRWTLKPIFRERRNITILCLLDAFDIRQHTCFVFRTFDFETCTRVSEQSEWLKKGRRLDDPTHLCDTIRAFADQSTRQEISRKMTKSP